MSLRYSGADHHYHTPVGEAMSRIFLALLPLIFLASTISATQDQLATQISKYQSGTVADRREAVTQMVILDDSLAVPTLTMALKDNDLTVRRISARGLGQFRAYSAAAALMELAIDSNRGAQEEAVEALSRLKIESGYSNLIQALGNSDPNVRRYAAKALGAIQAIDAIPDIVEIADDPYVDVRLGVIDGLASLAPAAKKELIAVLDSNINDLTKITVITGIAVARPKPEPDPELSKALVKQLKDPNPEVGLAAAKALKHSADNSVLACNDGSIPGSKW